MQNLRYAVLALPASLVLSWILLSLHFGAWWPSALVWLVLISVASVSMARLVGCIITEHMEQTADRERACETARTLSIAFCGPVGAVLVAAWFSGYAFVYSWGVEVTSVRLCEYAFIAIFVYAGILSALAHLCIMLKEPRDPDA